MEGTTLTTQKLLRYVQLICLLLILIQYLLIYILFKHFCHDASIDWFYYSD